MAPPVYIQPATARYRGRSKCTAISKCFARAGFRLGSRQYFWVATLAFNETYDALASVNEGLMPYHDIMLYIYVIAVHFAWLCVSIRVLL